MVLLDHANVERSDVCEQVFETDVWAIDQLDVFAMNDCEAELRERRGSKVLAPLTVPLHLEGQIGHLKSWD
jgi:hypothetical protein